jgi:hypothetical protein
VPVDGPLDGVAQLPAVALGEGLPAEVADRVVGQVDGGAELGGDGPGQPPGLGLDVVGAVAQGRDLQGQPLDPRQERQGQLAGAAALLPGGRLDGQDDGRLGLAADLLLAQAAVFAVLQERVEDGRAGRGQAVEVVQQQDPPAGRGDQAGAVLPGVGEGASLVAEEDAPQQGLVGQLVARGDRQGGLPPVRRRVEDGGQPALAGAALAV